MESDSRSLRRGDGTLEELMRERIRATIETLIDEELEAALGAGRSQRVGSIRAGYRHGKRERTLTTSLGATTIDLPRARIESADGGRSEWHSRMIPRYQRRTERIDEAILGVYLSGTNTRRLRGALLAIAINGWNRVAIAFRSIAGEYQPGARKIGASDEETSAHIVSRVQPVPRVQPADCTGCKGHFADVKTVARYSG